MPRTLRAQKDGRMALEQAGEALPEAVLADAAASLDGYVDGKGLRISMESHLLMARG